MSKRANTKHPQEQKDQWVEMYRNEKSFREIAIHFSVPYPTVFHYVRKQLGITDGRRTGRKKTYEGLSANEVVRQGNLRRNYGITLAQYDEMVVSQNGLCAICGEPARGGRTSSARLHVDHNHMTGVVRQLLCTDCNTGLGKFRDSALILDKASAYLRSHQVQ